MPQRGVHRGAANDPFISDDGARPISHSQRLPPRPRAPRPRDFRFNIDIPYDNPLEQQEGENRQRRGQAEGQIRERQQQRTWGQLFQYAMEQIWFAIKYAFTLGGSLGNTGLEQQDFGCGPAVSNDDRLLAALDLN